MKKQKPNVSNQVQHKAELNKSYMGVPKEYVGIQRKELVVLVKRNQNGITEGFVAPTECMAFNYWTSHVSITSRFGASGWVINPYRTWMWIWRVYSTYGQINPLLKSGNKLSSSLFGFLKFGPSDYWWGWEGHLSWKTCSFAFYFYQWLWTRASTRLKAQHRGNARAANGVCVQHMWLFRDGLKLTTSHTVENTFIDHCSQEKSVPSHALTLSPLCPSRPHRFSLHFALQMNLHTGPQTVAITRGHWCTSAPSMSSSPTSCWICL